jgi:hypothetical protein
MNARKRSDLALADLQQFSRRTVRIDDLTCPTVTGGAVSAIHRQTSGGWRSD